MQPKSSQHIALIGSSSHVDNCGRKAQQIFCAASYGFVVPRGFALSAKICQRISANPNNTKYARILTPYINALLQSTGNSKLIVRSSSSFEDCGKYQFSGLFNSYLNITTVEEVFIAIKKIVKKARSRALRPYFLQAQRDYRAVHMGVIVQEQIEPHFSGVATIHQGKAQIEFALNHPHALLQGAKDAVSVQLNFSREPEISRIQNCPPSLHNNKIRNIIQLFDFKKIQNFFGSCIIEFGVFNSTPYLFQIRNGKETILNLASDYAESLEKFNVVGSKAFAMHFFKDQNLFQHPLKLVPAGADFHHVAHEIHELFRENRPITIRFSRGNELGLPRAFVQNFDEAVSFFSTYYHRSFTTIAHTYIDVVRSFELLIGQDFSLLEHVPGMWESENSLHPDVIRIVRGKVDIFKFLKNRPLTVGRHIDEQETFAGPISSEDIGRFIHLLDDVREAVISNSNIKLPVNVHAVHDATSGLISCINIRPGFDLRDKPVYETQFHLVRNESDLETWDKKSALRLSLRTSRGSEKQLIRLAKALASVRVPLVVDFGLLSHPAMILREYGCKLIPAYRVPACFDKGNYSHSEMQIDVDFDAYVRMMQENPVSVGLNYLILKDREPISEMHLLGVAKKRSPSVADSLQIREVCDIFDRYEKEIGPIFFYERGRAPFCTSGFAQSQDHFHLIGELDIRATFDAMSKHVQGNVFASLCQAYDHIPASGGEYCVFGSASTGFRAGEMRLGKRILRNIAVTL